MIDPATHLEVSDTNGSHPDVVLAVLLEQYDGPTNYGFDFGSPEEIHG